MKNFLITGYYFDGFHGSMMHICEIAEELKRKNFKVYIASVEIRQTIKDYVEKQTGATLCFIEDLPLDIEYEYALCYHEPIISYLISKNIKIKHLALGSLSSYTPEEFPSILCKYNLPLFVHSQELKRTWVEKLNIDSNNIYVFLNSVGESFTRRGKHTELQKVAVVSNHVPAEIIEACKIMQQNGIDVDIYGKDYIYKPITSEILDLYDVVISIGKTVQYCLYKGIPVYNYDRFGGSGYITKSNIDEEEFFNFSGRSKCRKLSSGDIVNEITTMYGNIADEAIELSFYAREKYSIKTNVEQLISIMGKYPLEIPNDADWLFYKQQAIYHAMHLIHYHNLKKRLRSIIGDSSLIYSFLNKVTLGRCFKNKLNETNSIKSLLS